MKTIAGLLFGTALVSAQSRDDNEEGVGNGEVKGSGSTEDSKQFFGYGFRRFYIRPFPIPTNNYPAGTTVSNSYSARVIADRWLAVQNQDDEDRVLALASGSFWAKVNSRQTSDEADTEAKFACPFAWPHGACTYCEYQADPASCHEMRTFETSFTAKADGFIAEYEYKDLKNNDGRCIYEVGLLSMQVNRYGKAVNARLYRAETKINCEAGDMRDGKYETRPWYHNPEELCIQECN